MAWHSNSFHGHCVFRKKKSWNVWAREDPLIRKGEREWKMGVWLGSSFRSKMLWLGLTSIKSRGRQSMCDLYQGNASLDLYRSPRPTGETETTSITMVWTLVLFLAAGLLLPPKQCCDPTLLTTSTLTSPAPHLRLSPPPPHPYTLPPDSPPPPQI